jgi:hypothetical protein
MRTVEPVTPIEIVNRKSKINIEVQIMSEDMNIPENVLAETENFAIIEVRDEDETFYDLDFGIVTVHLDEDEYEEFLDLIKQMKERGH